MIQRFESVKGVYLVFFEMTESEEIQVGALGEMRFEPGLYVYVGSAMNSLESRVQRHVSGSKDNTYWHIDYFSAVADPIGFAAFAVSSGWECILSETANEQCTGIDGFGASDCACNAHLYRIDNLNKKE